MKVEMDGSALELPMMRGQRTNILWGRNITALPHRRTVFALSRKYLSGKLEKWDLPICVELTGSVYVRLTPGTTIEQRAAFLAALLTRCKKK